MSRSRRDDVDERELFHAISLQLDRLTVAAEEAANQLWWLCLPVWLTFGIIAVAVGVLVSGSILSTLLR